MDCIAQFKTKLNKKKIKESESLEIGIMRLIITASLIF